MRIGLGPLRVAVALTLLAALLSATYYILVLAISPGTRPSSLLVYPFLIGGVAYAVRAIGAREGRAFLRVWAEPAAYLRTAFLVGYQLSVLAATYLAGPTDASLLSLIGDVVATPLVALLLLGRSAVRSGWFAVGVALSLAGGALTIVGGRSLGAIPPIGWAVVPAVPLSVAFYVLLTSQANEQRPPSAAVGQSMLGAGLCCLAIAPALPGGLMGLVPPDPVAWGFLAVLGLTTFFATPVLYFAAIHRVGPALPPVLMTAIPVFTLILSGVVLHLPESLLAAVGVPVAIVGGIVALRGSLPPKVPSRNRGGERPQLS